MVAIRGNYRVDGNVFVFQISGNGPFQVRVIELLFVPFEPFLKRTCYKKRLVKVGNEKSSLSSLSFVLGHLERCNWRGLSCH